LTVRRKASDLLVAISLLHGADHLAGNYVQQDIRNGGIVPAVQGSLASRRSGQRRQDPRRAQLRMPARPTRPWSWFAKADPGPRERSR
jgi:hypothetical protein